MRILFPFVSSKFGGSCVSGAMVAEGLINRGHDVRVVFLYQGLAVNFMQKKRLAPIVMRDRAEPQGYGPVVFAKYFLDFIFGFRRFPFLGFDVIHCNDDRSILFWGSLFRFSKSKLLWHVRSSMPSSLDRMRLFLADNTVSVSNFTAARLPKGRSRVLYNPVKIPNRSENRRQIFARLGIPPNSVLVAQVGRDSERKNLEWSLPVIGLAIPKQPIYLVYLGEVSVTQKNQLVRCATDLSLPSGNIRFVGHVDNVYDYLRIVDLVLHPCDATYFGLDRVIQECLVLGTPIVVRELGANLELVGREDAVYLAGSSRQEFVSAISEAVVRMRLPHNKRKPRNDLFSQEAHIQNILTIYAELLSFER